METVLFTDLEGFSTLAEKLEPQALMSWLNVYMETLTKLVMEHGGIVDNYLGDGMKADFGVPLPRTTDAEIRQDAINAVNCALAMEREMIRFRAHCREQGLPFLRLRVGIFTGPAVAGNVGSARRLKYTTLGDTVNIASRLESYKGSVPSSLASRPCRILLGAATLRYVNDLFQTERIGEVIFKGKDQKITAYWLIGAAAPAESQQNTATAAALSSVTKPSMGRSLTEEGNDAIP
jgi:adenylate cyclase